MSIPEQVTHPSESPVLEGEVSHPGRTSTVADDTAGGNSARTGKSASKGDEVVKRPLPPMQVMVAAGLVLVAVELVLWQVGGVMIALLAHVVLATAAAMTALVVWLGRRARDRRTGRGAGRLRGSERAGAGSAGGRGAPGGGGLLSRLRSRGNTGAGGGRTRGGGSGAGGSGAGRPSSRIGGLLSRMRPGGRAASGSTRGGASGAASGGSPSRGGAGSSAGGRGRMRGLLSRMRRPGSGESSGRAATRRPGSAPRETGKARHAGVNNGGSPGSGAAGGAGGRRGALSRAANRLRRGRSSSGGLSAAGRSAGRSTNRSARGSNGGAAGSDASAKPGRRGPGLGRAFLDGVRDGARRADDRFKAREGKSTTGAADKDKTSPAADADAETQDAAKPRRGWRERLLGRKENDQDPQNTPTPTAVAGPPESGGVAHEPRHKHRPGEPDPGLVKEEIARAAKTVRKPAVGHQPRHSNTPHQPQHTAGGSEMDASRIKSAADELQAALTSYDPGAMRQLLRDVPAIGEALAGVGAGVKAIANRAESDFPVAGPVVEALHTMASDITAAGDTADVGGALQGNHETDIERHDAPRGGSKATEARWDVTTDED